MNTNDGNTEVVTPKSGWATSQGQMTAIFTVACILLSFVGVVLTPEQMQGWVDRAEAIAALILPLLAVIVPLVSYINSRGKIQSNALNANAAIHVAKANALAAPLTPLVSSADGLTKIIGGDDWKDPDRYENLLKIGAALGVPGAGVADKVNQQLHPADILTGILSILKNKTDAK